MKTFITLNIKTLLGMFIGLISGYIHWYYWGCYWGVYPMSFECWVNWLMGTLFGGFIVSLTDKKNI